MAGSDPGISICAPEQVTDELIEYGQCAVREVLTQAEAFALAGKNGILLAAVGGTGDGIIGALAAVALTAGGNAGRYVLLPGIRDIDGMVTVGQLIKTTNIISVIDEKGQVIGDKEVIDSLGWIRPSLIGGQAVLRVRLAQDLPGGKVWAPAERASRKDKK